MTDLERALADGGERVETDLSRALAGGGAVVNTGPDPRRGMRPEPKSDFDLGIADGPITTAVPRNPLREAFPRATARSHAEDPFEHDPLAGMIAQGILAHGAGVLAGGVVPAGAAPLVTNTVTGAVANPDDPFTGAALGAIPALPGAARAGGRAIGDKALQFSNAGGSLVPAAKAAGTAVGTMAGHSAVPYVGAPIGAALGAKIGGSAGRVADRAIGALGRRRMVQMASEAPPVTLTPEILSGTPLAPLVPEPRAPVEPPPGIFGKEPVNPFDELTRGGPPASNHATVGDATKLTSADIARDAAKFRAEPAEQAATDTIGAQLMESIRLLDELRAGKITPDEALKAGLSPAAVKKASGR